MEAPQKAKNIVAIWSNSLTLGYILDKTIIQKIHVFLLFIAALFTTAKTWSEVKWSEVAQSCPTLCNPMGCSPPGSSVHWIFQARVLEWVAISFSRGSSWLRDWTRVSCIVSRRFTVWATRAKTWEQPTCSLTDEWMKNMCLIYHTMWSQSEREKWIPYDIPYMWNLKYDTSEPIYEIETDSQT